MKRLTLLIALLLMSVQGFACTSAVISGRATADGRPLLWKLRDSGSVENALDYFQGDGYSFTGIINCEDTNRENVWMGANETGFAIMNTHSYNVNFGHDCGCRMDREGEFMKLALSRCRNLADFEKLLSDSVTFWGLSANFGVIDAEGGAAYYETGCSSFRKYDVNDPQTAPEGYLLRTNYSFSGEKDRGHGYIRYAATEALFNSPEGTPLNAEFLIRKASRNLVNGYTGINLRKVRIPRRADEKFMPFQDYVVNTWTVSVMAVQGVKKDENPENTLMWVIPGWPLTTPALPVWVGDRDHYPSILKRGEDGHCPLNAAGLAAKAECIPDTRGDKENYLNIVPLLKRSGPAYLRNVESLENSIFEAASEREGQIHRDGSVTAGSADFQSRIEALIKTQNKGKFNQ